MQPIAPSVLFLDKVFLRDRSRVPLRGVELFNLNLLRDLVGLGIPVTVVAHPSWNDDLEAVLKGRQHDIVRAVGGIEALRGVVAAFRLAGRRFDVLLLGNVGNRILGCLGLLKLFRAFDRRVLIAHRETSGRFLRALRGLKGHIVCVNGKIAEPFTAGGFPNVHVDYGIMNADDFRPALSLGQPHDTVNFCVIGMLDNAWKGSDTAVAAFRMLPAALRLRCRLHLCAFSSPPKFTEPEIIAYPWMDAAHLPDLLRRMDVMIVPSRDESVMRETFSQAMVQGMLTGLPQIVNDLPVLKEKLDRGGGCVFHNEKELADAMARLAADPALREAWGRIARDTALSRYVWDTARFVERYLRSA